MGRFNRKRRAFPFRAGTILRATSGQFSSDRNSIGSAAVVAIVAPHKQALWAVSTSTAKGGGDYRGGKAFFKMPITLADRCGGQTRRVRSIIVARGRNPIANPSESAAPHFHLFFLYLRKAAFASFYAPPPPCPLRLFWGEEK